MKITARVRYASMAVLYSSMKYGRGMTTIKEICAELGISLKYMENIMCGLVKAGIFTSKKGKRGGFFLARTPKYISMYDVVQAAEGSLEGIARAGKPDNRLDSGYMREVWRSLGEKIEEHLRPFNFQEMVDRQKNVDQELKRLKKEYRLTAS